MKGYKKIILLFLFIISSCVGPPDYLDGLLENIPAVVNEEDFFSLSILGDNLTEEHDWNLALTVSNSDILLQTVVIKDIPLNSDSSNLLLSGPQGDTIMIYPLISNATYNREDSVQYLGELDKIIFTGNDFSGRLEYQILKK